MIDTLYIESGIAEHPRCQTIMTRFPKATRIECETYQEVFNPKAQNFRLQKRKPALILAEKRSAHLLPAPSGYGIGSAQNFYFSHMYNCVYDCRYCFLQGKYRSAHYVLFVNYEDFTQAITQKLNDLPGKACWFFSGYECDSLALDPVSGFADYFLDFFATEPRAFLELRTKSTQVRQLLQRQASANVVVAFSFTPPRVAKALEHKAPSISNRIRALHKLAAHGWQVGIRLDPLIDYPDFQSDYRQLLGDLLQNLPAEQLHSVSLGAFRLPQTYFKTMQRLYPDEALFAGALQTHAGMVGYAATRERELFDICENLLRDRIDPKKLFPCATVA